MVTGRVPFEGDTTVAVAIKHLQEEMVPPSIYTPELPYSLEQIILKCTQKSVDRRYGTMEEVIADLKHSLIDPQGDFVKLTTVDNDAKTVVISERELGEIKHTPKTNIKAEPAELEKEISSTEYDEIPDEDEGYRRRKERKEKKRKKKKSAGRGLTIAALILGAALLVVLIVMIGKEAGLIGGDDPAVKEPTVVDTPAENDGLVEVPDFTGKSEKEATTDANALSLGIRVLG